MRHCPYDRHWRGPVRVRASIHREARETACTRVRVCAYNILLWRWRPAGDGGEGGRAVRCCGERKKCKITQCRRVARARPIDWPVSIRAGRWPRRTAQLARSESPPSPFRSSPAPRPSHARTRARVSVRSTRTTTGSSSSGPVPNRAVGGGGEP